MINVATVDVSSLPSVRLCDRSQLPSSSGVYFVIDSGKVWYIGQARNIRARWANHHRKGDFLTLERPKIYWFLCDVGRLLEAEAVAIEYFNPYFNLLNQACSLTFKRQKQFHPEDWLHGEKKTGKQFMLTPTADAVIDGLVKLTGLSRSEVLERVLRTQSFDADVINSYKSKES